MGCGDASRKAPAKRRLGWGTLRVTGGREKSCLEGGCAGFGYGVVLIAGAAADADGAYNLATFFSGMPPAKIMILPLLEAWMPKNCPPDCEWVARSLVVMSKAREV